MEIEPHPVPLYSVLWGDRPVDGRTETERGRNTEREREREMRQTEQAMRTH